ncbi:probable glycosyltransferase BC10 at C-terminar half [Coccomyxa sp. Obi]|nr:probable glycosyltransferase BC10 at C-terminar half [Coccomyxa sp. Obi]
MRDQFQRGDSRIPLLGSPAQLRSALGLSPSPPRSPAQHSPRSAVSTTIFRTCAFIAALVIVNAILAGIILSAVNSFSGSNNKLVQPPGPHGSPPGYSTFVRTGQTADSALVQPEAALYAGAPEGEESRRDGFGKPLWWPRVFGVTAPAQQPSAAGASSEASNASLLDSGSAGWDYSPKEEQEALTSAVSSPDHHEQLAGEWETASNSSWITQVEELYMEDDLTDNAPAASAAPEEEPIPKGMKPTTASPRPAAAPETSTPSAAEHTLGGQNPAASAGSREHGSETSPDAAPAEAASPAPASEGSVATDEPAMLSRAVGGGAIFVSEATLPWEHLAEASMDEEAEALALQQEALIEQEQAVGEGSEVEAFGERYSSGDVAGSFIGSVQTAPALAPAPTPAPEHAPDPCAAALNIPKVAIMFLSKAELFHESSWALWFQHAAGLLPVSALQATSYVGKNGSASCDEERVRLAQRWCSPAAQGSGVLQRQHLFNVYIHPLPDYGYFPEESIFRGREIEDRIQVSWGAHELVLAARNLLRAAIRDPLNQKFVLLSESGVPLYPPATVYSQLMVEDKSRIDSCGIGRTDPWRFSGRMGWKLREHWRKSSQWFAVTRKHAQLVLEDTHILDLFQRYCQNAWDNDVNRWRDCFSDEHYMPSLLAYLQLGHETDCVGRLVGVDWSQGGAHPRSYSVQDVNPDKMVSLRLWANKCDDQEAIRSSAGQFVYEADLQQLGSSPGACGGPGGYNGTALGYDCPLFARKFPRETASAVYNLFRSCTTGLNITNAGLCAEGAAEIGDQRVGNEHLARRELGEGSRKMLVKGRAVVPPWQEEQDWL